MKAASGLIENEKKQALDQVQANNKEVLIDHFLSMIGAVCHDCNLMPGDLFTGKKKDGVIVSAREMLSLNLRRTVGIKKGVNPKEWVVIPQGLDLGKHVPISYPVLGRLFGMDHSSMILMVQRAKRSEVADDKNESGHSDNGDIHGGAGGDSDKLRVRGKQELVVARKSQCAPPGTRGAESTGIPARRC